MENKKLQKRFFSGLAAVAVIALCATLANAFSAAEINLELTDKKVPWFASDYDFPMELGLLYEEFNLSIPMLEEETAFKKALPSSIDWRDYNGKNYVTPVKDQGKCGGCWAFAATGALESYLLRTQNSTTDLSEQTMISCSKLGSCGGGFLFAAAQFVKVVGVPPESYLPYTAKDGDCSAAAPGWRNQVKKINKWKYACRTPWGKVQAIKAALVKYGPLATSFTVFEDFKKYKSGVYSYVTGKNLGHHAVLLVGYNDDGKYFIVKNSWSPKWGENGYFRIAYSQTQNDVKFGRGTLAYTD